MRAPGRRARRSGRTSRHEPDRRIDVRAERHRSGEADRLVEARDRADRVRVERVGVDAVRRRPRPARRARARGPPRHRSARRSSRCRPIGRRRPRACARRALARGCASRCRGSVASVSESMSSSSRPTGVAPTCAAIGSWRTWTTSNDPSANRLAIVASRRRVERRSMRRPSLPGRRGQVPASRGSSPPASASTRDRRGTRWTASNAEPRAARCGAGSPTTGATSVRSTSCIRGKTLAAMSSAPWRRSTDGERSTTRTFRRTRAPLRRCGPATPRSVASPGWRATFASRNHSQ